MWIDLLSTTHVSRLEKVMTITIEVERNDQVINQSVVQDRAVQLNKRISIVMENNTVVEVFPSSENMSSVLSSSATQ